MQISSNENDRFTRNKTRTTIEVEPAYASRYAGLSEFYGISAALGMMPPNDGWQMAEALMTKAQQLDNMLPEVAAIRMFRYRDWEGAKLEIKFTIELNPNFAEVYNLH